MQAGSRDEPAPRRTDQHGPRRSELRRLGAIPTKLLYEQYGILENPFGMTPNPRYFYQSRNHAEAKSSLIIGIECGLGFQALIAPPGMGKTTILFDILERFNQTARTAFLFQSQGDSRDFLRYLMVEFGGEVPDTDLVHIQNTLNRLFISERRAGRRTIIIIDEAQSLDISVLETIRLLSNFETNTEKLLQIILAGQPQLAQTLASPELSQLSQRIAILTTLAPFDLEDTKNYIEHRLKIAGYQGSALFTSTAVKLIWNRSRGVPREINSLCFNALLLARAVDQKQIDADILHEVIADLDLHRLSRILAHEIQSEHSEARLADAAEREPIISGDNGSSRTVPADRKEELPPSPTAPNTIDVVQLSNSLDALAAPEVTKATSSGTQANQAAGDVADGSGDMATSNFLIDRLVSVDDPKVGVVARANAGVVDAPSGGETEAAGSATEAPHCMVKTPPITSDLMREPKPSLESGVASVSTPAGELNLAEPVYSEVKPRIEPDASSLIQLHLTSETHGSAQSSLAPESSHQAQQLWRTAKQLIIFSKEFCKVYRASIYLATAASIVLLVLLIGPPLKTPSEPNVTMFKEILWRLGLADRPPVPVNNGKPEIQVWLDARSGFYYCPGTQLYGKSQDGKFVTEREAQRERFQAANHSACK
jgi:general secretion pathway protein A